ncbi:MAG: hypothetical protein V3S00_01310, partial [Dehalococcoidia bacterium]
MLANVLVTIDGSKLSEVAIPVVADLVEGTGAHVTIFAADEVPTATADIADEASLVPRPDVSARSATAPPAVRAIYSETRTQAITRREQE